MRWHICFIWISVIENVKKKIKNSSNYQPFLRQNFVYKNNLVRNNRTFMTWMYLPLQVPSWYFWLFFDFWFFIGHYLPFSTSTSLPSEHLLRYLCRDDENLLKNTWKRAFFMSIFVKTLKVDEIRSYWPYWL